jgi:hypothetical protein
LALIALAPKCVLCGLAYAGIGAALGFGRSSICGSTAGSVGRWVSLPVAYGIAVGVAGWLAFFKGIEKSSNGGGSPAERPNALPPNTQSRCSAEGTQAIPKPNEIWANGATDT